MRQTIKVAALGIALLAGTSVVRADEVADQAQQLIDKGLNYLKSQQQPDGSWQKSEKEPPALTALALRAFVQDSKYNAKTDFVAKGFDKLLSYQTEDGGIYKSLLANYNTAIAVSTLTAAKEPSFQPKIDKAVDYLKRLQWTQETRPEYVNAKEQFTGKQVVQGTDDPFYGGWGYGGRGRGAGRPDLSNTQMAIEALRDAGLKSDDPVLQRALVFVTRCQNNSETNPAKWAGNGGGFVYGPSDDRNGESFAGAYTDAAGNRRLRSMGTMSYAGLKSLVYCGVGRDDPRVKAAWKWVSDNFTVDTHPGMAELGEEQGKAGLFYYYMVMGKALHAFGQPTLQQTDGKTVDWRRALVEKLAKIQNEDGSWVGTKEHMENNRVLVTSYVVLALQATQQDLQEHPAQAAQ